jgi:hypothetical protein
MAITAPTDISNLLGWVKADTLSLSDGEAVETWTRSGGSIVSNPTQATLGNRPAFRANRLAGRAVIEFDGTDAHFTWGSSGDWNDLHSGGGCTIFVVAAIRDTTGNPNAVMGVIDTVANSSVRRGFGLYYDDRSSAGRFDAQSLYVGSGAGGTAPVANFVNGTWRTNSWYAQAASYRNQTSDDFFQYANKRSLASGGQSASPSSSNSTYALNIGRMGNATAYFRGWIAEIIVYNKELDASERAEVFDYLRQEYGPGLLYAQEDTPDTNIVNVVADSRYAAFGAVDEKADGTLYATYRDGTTHQNDKGVIQRQTSGDMGETWSSASQIHSDATHDARDPSSLLLANGSRLLTYFLFNHSAQSFFAAGAKSRISASDDDSYGSEATITTGFDQKTTTATKPIQLASGDILTACNGKDAADARESSVCCISEDNGATWTELSTIVNGVSAGFHAIEPNLCMAADGSVIALVRDETNKFIRRYRSTDDGATWDSGQFSFFGWGAPRPIIAEADGFHCLALMYRDSATDESRFRVSTDNGITWSEQIDLDDSSSGVYTYGHWIFREGRLYAFWAHEESSTDSDFFWREVLKLADTGGFNAWYASQRSRILGSGLGV